jgi:thymidylate synthase (FAD)
VAIEFVDHSTVRLIKTNASDVDVAHAAWVSNFGADAETRDTSNIGKLIDFLYSNRHMSPFEHGSFTFFVDTPIFVAREFMRHRTFSYNETSGRYKELEPRFYLPPRERPLVQHGRPGAYTFTEGTNEQYAMLVQAQRTSFEYSWAAYQHALGNGVAREVARNVLPLATMTQFYATVNPRNLLHFLDLRDDNPALFEIREVAKNEMRKAMETHMPLTYSAYERFDWRKDKARIVELENEVERLKSKHFEGALS